MTITAIARLIPTYVNISIVAIDFTPLINQNHILAYTNILSYHIALMTPHNCQLLDVDHTAKFNEKSLSRHCFIANSLILLNIINDELK